MYKVIDHYKLKEIVDRAIIYTCFPSCLDRGRAVQHEELIGAITVNIDKGVIENMVDRDGFVVRKVTPKECWRAMDIPDENFNKAQEVNSNAQLYKQAGNGIVINCLTAIFGQLFKGHENDYIRDCELEEFKENKTNYKITKPVRLIELFGGIGCQSMALDRLGVDYEHYRLVEFDKYPIKSYNAIHGTHFKPTNITEVTGNDLQIVDKDKYEYIMSYSFPCTDLSVAGLQKGMKKDTNTSSSLLWEVERLLTEVENKPQILVMENVTQVHNKRNINDFQQWIDFLTSLGYKNFYADMNAVDYGVPQSRNRCFMVSILTDDDNIIYDFPAKLKLNKCMQDLLEDEVDDKFIIKTERAKKLVLDVSEEELIKIERELKKRKMSQKPIKIWEERTEIDNYN